MKSWLHNIAESYIYETPATRRDLKEHYNLLTEEEKFALLSENAIKYLDEQLKTAYGFGVGDLTEEELGSILSTILEFKGPLARSIVMARKEDEPGFDDTRARAAHPSDPGFIFPNLEAAKLRAKRLAEVERLVDDPNVKLRKRSKDQLDKSYNRVKTAARKDKRIVDSA